MTRAATLLLALALAGCSRATPSESKRSAASPDATPALPPQPAAAPDAARQPLAAAPDAAVVVAEPDASSCGGETCRPGQFCEDRYKGHAIDDEGRPLDQIKCVPLPKQCRKDATCSCVTKHLATTSCTDTGGLVRTGDYPRRHRRGSASP